jgi:hypothetical protein
MLDREAARQLALDIIEPLAKASGRHYVILEDAVQEHPLAWVFPFNSDVYAASRDRRDAVLGIAPIAVKRTTGEARMGTPVRFSAFLERFLAEDEDDAPAPLLEP